MINRERFPRLTPLARTPELDAVTETHRYLEAVGEEFEIATGGYTLLRDAPNEAARLVLRCEIDDERMDVFATPGEPLPPDPRAVANRLAAHFDRSVRESSNEWTILPPVDLSTCGRVPALGDAGITDA